MQYKEQRKRCAKPYGFTTQDQFLVLLYRIYEAIDLCDTLLIRYGQGNSF